jgi:tetratricopeptide (TPR) repeat protein
VTHNPLLRDGAGLWKIWFDPAASPQYYPLAFSVLWIEWQAWGAGALGYHLLNVALHALNALLVWRVLLRLEFCGGGWAPWVAGLLFGVHPVCVETAAWITEIKNTLSGAFYLTALLAYLRFQPLGQSPPSDEHERDWRWYGLALGAFVLALLSKTIVATLPAAVLVLIAWRRGAIGPRRDVLPLVPFFALGVGFGLMTAYLERTHVGAQGEDFLLSALDRVVLAGQVPWVYASKLALPTSLNFVYPRWTPDAGEAWHWIGLAGVLALLGVCWRVRERTQRGPLCAVLLFGGTLFPVLGFVDVYPFRFSWIADHFQYLACIPLLALSVAGGKLLLGRLPTPKARPFLVACVAVTLAALTGVYAFSFRSPEILWRSTLERNPQAWLAHNNLGQILAKQKKIAEAAVHFGRAVSLKPNESSHQMNFAWALSRLGDERADLHYNKTLELSPDSAPARFFYGEHLQRTNRVDQAIDLFCASLALDPENPVALSRISQLLIRLRRGPEALRRVDGVVQAAPHAIAPRIERARLLAYVGRGDEALAELEAVVAEQAQHAEAHQELGRLLRQRGDLEGSREHLRRAAELGGAR